MEPAPTIVAPESGASEAGASANLRPKRRTRRKGTATRGESVPLETVVALRDQLESLERSFQEDLAAHERLVKKLKSKLKRQKVLVKAAAEGEVEGGGGGARTAQTGQH